MPKFVIVGSCKHRPYTLIQAPNPLDLELYNRDHELAYVEACKIYYPAIDRSEQVWVYAPKAIGEHSRRDLEYAIKQDKAIRFIVTIDDLTDDAKARLFNKATSLTWD